MDVFTRYQSLLYIYLENTTSCICHILLRTALLPTISCFSKRVIFARFLYDVPFITRNIFRRIIGEAIKVRSIVLFHSVSRQNWITLGSRSEWVLSKKQSLASSTLLWNIIRIKRMPSSDFLATGCGFRLSTRLASHFRKIKYIGSFEYISTISSTFVSRLFFFSTCLQST